MISFAVISRCNAYNKQRLHPPLHVFFIRVIHKHFHTGVLHAENTIASTPGNRQSTAFNQGLYKYGSYRGKNQSL